jgi:integrase
MLEAYALRYFDARLRLTDLSPQRIAAFIAWLCDPEKQDGRTISDKTIRNILGPLRACLATARREGILRQNPCDGAQLPHRPQVEDDDEDDVRALGRDTLGVLLAMVHPRYRLLFTLLAATGLRISEAIALQWRHVQLDGDRPHVKVRRRIVRGNVGPPKSRHSKRDVPLPASLVNELRTWQRETEWPGAEALVFPTTTGTCQSKDNLRNRYLKPAAEEAGAAWAGLHTFRHTFASLHIARGTNVVQLSKLLGHHSPAFTLSTYSHLLDDGVGAALDLADELAGSNSDQRTRVATGVATSAAFGRVRSEMPDSAKAA